MVSIIDEIIELDRQRIRAMIGKDIGKLDQLLADDLAYIHSNAKKDNKASLFDAMLSGAASYRQIDITDIEGRDFGDTVVLIGSAAITVSSFGIRTAVNVRFTNVYVRRDGRWQMAVWQETESSA